MSMALAMPGAPRWEDTEHESRGAFCEPAEEINADAPSFESLAVRREPMPTLAQEIETTLRRVAALKDRCLAAMANPMTQEVTCETRCYGALFRAELALDSATIAARQAEEIANALPF